MPEGLRQKVCDLSTGDKKMIRYALVSIMTVALFAGCGDETEAQGTDAGVGANLKLSPNIVNVLGIPEVELPFI